MQLKDIKALAATQPAISLRAERGATHIVNASGQVLAACPNDREAGRVFQQLLKHGAVRDHGSLLSDEDRGIGSSTGNLHEGVCVSRDGISSKI